MHTGMAVCEQSRNRTDKWGKYLSLVVIEHDTCCAALCMTHPTPPPPPLLPPPFLPFSHFFLQELALDAVTTVAVDIAPGKKEIDTKQYAKVEKIPGGRIEDSCVLRGVMFNKDLVAPGKMRRRIENPRVILLDSPLEYKKGENQTNVEIMKEEDW